MVQLLRTELLVFIFLKVIASLLFLYILHTTKILLTSATYIEKKESFCTLKLAKKKQVNKLYIYTFVILSTLMRVFWCLLGGRQQGSF